jgi:hypothetical protein
VFRRRRYLTALLPASGPIHLFCPASGPSPKLFAGPPNRRRFLPTDPTQRWANGEQGYPLQLPFRLYLLPSAVRPQPARRSRTMRATAGQCRQRVGPGAVSGHDPLASPPGRIRCLRGPSHPRGRPPKQCSSLMPTRVPGGSRSRACRVVGRVEWHPGECFPCRVCRHQASPSRPARLRGGLPAVDGCNAVRVHFHALADNHRLALPETVRHWQLTTLRETANPDRRQGDLPSLAASWR